jgi:hypothetical protein
MNNPADLHEGTAVRLGGRDYIVPALTLRMVRRFENDLGRAFEVGPLSPAKDRRLALEIIHAAMSRNYPKLTVDELEDLLDLGTTPKVFLAVMGLSGLLKKDGDSAGETKAGA